MHPRVYLVDRTAPCRRGHLRAAVAWAGDDAVASGLSAAQWWGLVPPSPGNAQVTVPRTRSRRPPDGVLLLRRDLDAADRTVRDGLPVTGLPLTVVDAALLLGPERGAPLLDRALQKGLPLAALRAAHSRMIGRRGAGRIGRLLGLAARGARSEAERLAHRVLDGAGVRGWRADHPVVVDGVRYVLDIAFPAVRLAIEIDGWAWHSSAERFRADRRRGNRVALAGWTVLRFTWDDLVHRPDIVVAQVRAALTLLGAA